MRLRLGRPRHSRDMAASTWWRLNHTPTTCPTLSPSLRRLLQQSPVPHSASTNLTLSSQIHIPTPSKQPPRASCRGQTQPQSLPLRTSTTFPNLPDYPTMTDTMCRMEVWNGGEGDTSMARASGTDAGGRNKRAYHTIGRRTGGKVKGMVASFERSASRSEDSDGDGEAGSSYARRSCRRRRRRHRSGSNASVG